MNSNSLSVSICNTSSVLVCVLGSSSLTNGTHCRLFYERLLDNYNKKKKKDKKKVESVTAFLIWSGFEYLFFFLLSHFGHDCRLAYKKKKKKLSFILPSSSYFFPFSLGHI